MDYRIVEKPAFHVAGKTQRVSTKNGENMRQIPEFWQACMGDGTFAVLSALPGDKPALGQGMLGICMDFAPDMSEFTYMIGAEAPSGASPAGMVERDIPASTWAVFQAKGALPDSIQTVWGRIMSEFLPAGEYAHAPAPDVEFYPPGDPMQPGYECSVWVPVVKK